MKTKKNSKTVNNSKAIIDTYSCIYPVDLVVANKYVTLEQLQELYDYGKGQELDDKVTNPESNATTTYVRRKEDDKACVLVKYNNNDCSKHVDKKLNYISTISHEAGHVALDIYDYIQQNICNCSPEPFCYLLGWATKCIYKTLNKK